MQPLFVQKHTYESIKSYIIGRQVVGIYKQIDWFLLSKMYKCRTWTTEIYLNEGKKLS